MNTSSFHNSRSQGQPNQSIPNLPPERLNSLLGMAGKQLGKDPQKLRAQIEGGQLNQVLSGLDPQKTAQINQILNNPQKLEQLLNSPQVKSLLGTLMKQK